jgi:hypothetical protein
MSRTVRIAWEWVQFPVCKDKLKASSSVRSFRNAEQRKVRENKYISGLREIHVKALYKADFEFGVFDPIAYCVQIAKEREKRAKVSQR